MSSDADIEGFVDALRQDGPSDHDAARMQARLAALGVVTGASMAKAAVASSMPAGKVIAGVATRWASLSLLPKIGVVTAVSATALVGAVAVRQHTEAPPDARASERDVATRSTAPVVQRDRVAAAPESTGPTALDDVAAAPQATGPAARDDVVAARSAPRAPQLDAPQAAGKSAVTAAARAGSHDAVPAASATPPSETATASFDRVAGAIATPAPASTLPEETALIDAAFAALRAGDTTAASALVAEHARRFPNGLLSRERQHALERLSKASATAPLR